MNPEKPELTKDQRNILVDKIVSTRSHFDAFLAHDQIMRTKVDYIEATVNLDHEQMFIGSSQGEDHLKLNKAIFRQKEAEHRLAALRDLIGQQMADDERFAKAYQEVQVGLETAGFSQLFDTINLESVIDNLDQIRQDYRVPLVELAFNIKEDSIKEKAFRMYADIAKKEMEHDFNSDTLFVRRAALRPLQERLKSLKQGDISFSPIYFQIQARIHEITRLSGVQGPFGEQFIIESIENLMDPDLKKERDRRVGRGRF